MDIGRIRTFLFVPANRPDRFDKALHSGADAIIVDLEDAVAPCEKEAARHDLERWLKTAPCQVFVRVNAAESEWHVGDLAACHSPAVCGILLPKAESVSILETAHFLSKKPVLPIIESAKGLDQLKAIAGAEGCARLVFGKLDLAVDLGLEQDERDKEEIVFHPYRAQLVLASRLARLPPPVEGVFTALAADDELLAYSRRARRDGFSAVLVIHPRQIGPVTTALTPSGDEVTWARRVLVAATEAGGNAAVVDGRMIDAPVIARANRILAAANQCQ
ncbi:MAG TPA: CoA ester lyase [Noviherbaspirillum sp.]|uniref:HpcH/HpaI aldolase/citrate lyase family protein n=1 Tax=Noviherbaspirillum sp. TaxID=1926288 RepID=UPI002B474AE8|nr:CoA ester lyase [Noviherbaspirillum sp.]HJV88162.1 CoA ester lyase [Noviherbaspirillum sp.]